MKRERERGRGEGEGERKMGGAQPSRKKRPTRGEGEREKCTLTCISNPLTMIFAKKDGIHQSAKKRTDFFCKSGSWGVTV